MAIWYNVLVIWNIFSSFWYVAAIKIWQPCSVAGIRTQFPLADLGFLAAVGDRSLLR
jgi:hypothetical protein